MNNVDTAIYQTLASNAALMLTATGVYYGVAPQGKVLPYVIFAKQSETDHYVFQGRICVEMMYLIKVVGKGSSIEAIRDAYNLVDIAVNNKRLALGVLQCRRESGLEYLEDDNGIIYYHVGGLYRLLVVP